MFKKTEVPEDQRFSGYKHYIIYKVEGYWTEDTVSLRIQEEDGELEVQIDYASGGYDDTIEDIKRTRNMAAALLDAADTADHLLMRPGLEKELQELNEKMDALAASDPNLFRNPARYQHNEKEYKRLLLQAAAIEKELGL